MMWELPAGRIDDGETAITAAKRELLRKPDTVPASGREFSIST